MKHTPIVHDGSHAGIKLRRSLVRGLQVGRVSPSFSFEKGFPGMQVHLYCTEGHGGPITDVVHGKLKRASSKGVRKWAFVPDRIEDVSRFNTAALVRL